MERQRDREIIPKRVFAANLLSLLESIGLGDEIRRGVPTLAQNRRSGIRIETPVKGIRDGEVEVPRDATSSLRTTAGS